MNLLLNDLPTKIIEINGNLYFDTDTLSDEDYESDSECITYTIETSNREIINIMKMYDESELDIWDKTDLMLDMFYGENKPLNDEKAYEKAMEFLDCGKETEASSKVKKRDYGRLWSFEQDGNYIYSAMNYSHNDILIKQPDLHWFEWNIRFMQLKEDCKFCEIVSNRLAHKLRKATKEQQTMRKEYPEIYVLKEQVKIDDEKLRKIREMQEKLNK